MNRNDGACSKTKCISYGRKSCTGNIYTQLSLEERTMVHAQLEIELFCLDALSRTLSKRLDLPKDASRP